MSALRIAVCEDTDRDAEHLCSMIEGSNTDAEISRFRSGGDFLASRPAGRYDIVFFDVLMGNLSGVETARAFREIDGHCGIVFTTSSEEYRADAFDVEAEQYLIKPVNKEKLLKVLWKRAPEQRRKSCPVNVKGRYKNIPLDDIIYIEVQNHTCFVHTTEGIIDTGSTMTIENFTALLPGPRFMRCHKSYLVNLSFVESIGRDFKMKNGDTVYIRRSDYAKCRRYERELDKWRLAEAGRDDV